MAVKFIRLNFYRFYGFQFPYLFGAHGITHLVEQKGCIYPDLIRVFYFNLKYRDGIVTKKDLLLLYGILNNIHIDWPALIFDTMVKAKKYHAYHLPYALLISRIIEYKGFRIEGELTEPIQAIGTEIGETTFRQMGFVVRGRVIIHKDDDHQDDEDDDMDAHMRKPVGVAAPSEVGPSTMPSSSSLSMEEYFANLSKQLENMSLAHQARFDELIEMQQTHEECVIEKFDDFDTRLGNIENRLNLHPLERPPTPDF
ncbi:hypothetical protein LR48_Vigan08g099300 [Vigna angularis]|uniref:Uncharacterized protein n=1 Tax=Phaseolus angularis TaxID=3914 RepID=A0A0L9V570_PHAAN|nr:hypothetical protein LR48_Vigan08g099300 [Vigna angularis]